MHSLVCALLRVWMQVCLRESVQIPICHGGHLPFGNKRGRRGSGGEYSTFFPSKIEKKKNI